MTEQEKNPKMNTTEQNYSDLNDEWTMVIFGWFIVSYIGSSYGYF